MSEKEKRKIYSIESVPDMLNKKYLYDLDLAGAIDDLKERKGYNSNLDELFPNEVVLALKRLLEIRIVAPEELAKMFFKDTDSRSTTIVMSKPFLNIAKSSDCYLTKKFSEEFKVKSEYLKKNNLNFFSTNEAGTKIYCANKSEFKRIYAKIVYYKILSSNTILLSRLSMISQNLYYVARVISRDILDEKSSGIYAQRVLNDLSSKFFSSQIFSIHSIVNKTRLSPGKLLEESIDGKRIKTKSEQVSLSDKKEVVSEISSLIRMYFNKIDGSDYTFTSAINNTFDYYSRIESILKSNTTIEKVKYVNPVSGFASIKHERRIKEFTNVSREQILSAISRGQEINILFSKVSDVIEQNKLKEKKKEEVEVKIVSGDEIVSLYNQRSYIKNSASGPLYNSCMRGQEVKERIKFYAKNPHFIRLLAVTNNNGKTLMARALAWYDQENDLYYIDRIFYSSNESKLLMTNFVNKNKNMKSIYSGESNYGISEKCTFFKIKINSVNSFACLSTPYLDSISSSTIKINGNRYMGKFSSEDINSSEETMPLISFTEKINEDGISTERCISCGKIAQNALKIIDKSGRKMTVCASHIKTLECGTKYILIRGERLCLLKSSPKKDALYVINVTKKPNQEPSSEVYEDTRVDTYTKERIRTELISTSSEHSSVLARALKLSLKDNNSTIFEYVGNASEYLGRKYVGSLFLPSTSYEGLYSKEAFSTVELSQKALNLLPTISRTSVVVPKLDFIEKNEEYFKDIIFCTMYKKSKFDIDKIDINKIASLLNENEQDKISFKDSGIKLSPHIDCIVSEIIDGAPVVKLLMLLPYFKKIEAKDGTSFTIRSSSYGNVIFKREDFSGYWDEAAVNEILQEIKTKLREEEQNGKNE